MHLGTQESVALSLDQHLNYEQEFAGHYLHK